MIIPSTKEEGGMQWKQVGETIVAGRPETGEHAHKWGRGVLFPPKIIFTHKTEICKGLLHS